jgi:hypothetical protein
MPFLYRERKREKGRWKEREREREREGDSVVFPRCGLICSVNVDILPFYEGRYAARI